MLYMPCDGVLSIEYHRSEARLNETHITPFCLETLHSFEVMTITRHNERIILILTGRIFVLPSRLQS